MWDGAQEVSHVFSKIVSFLGCTRSPLLPVGFLRVWQAGTTLWLRCMCSRGARALGCAGSGVAVHGLSCPVARGIFSDQGLNPCSLYWLVNSDHQGSPVLHISFLFLQFYVCYISESMDFVFYIFQKTFNCYLLKHNPSSTLPLFSLLSSSFSLWLWLGRI